MWHDNETKIDLLGYARYSKIIQDLSQRDSLLPTTIGLFGDWGSGKSSILGMIENIFENKSNTLCLRFDGWLFEGYDDAKSALMTEIIRSIEKKVSDNEGIRRKAKKLLKRVNWFRVAGLATKGVISLTTPLSSITVIPSLIQNFSDIANKFGADPDKVKSEITKLIKPKERKIFENVREFRNDFESLIIESKLSPVVILIDDLDRCLPESIISTLEAIKLFLSVPGTAFIIAADERIVRNAIVQRYPISQYQNQDLTQDYLEKLIQLPIKIPPLTEITASCYMYLLFAERTLKAKHQDNFLELCKTVDKNRENRSLPEPLNYGIARDVLQTLAKDLQSDFNIVERISPTLCKGLDGNPRLIKRFLNTFSLRLLMADSMGLILKPEILAKLMVLERFYEDRFRELFEWQRNQNGISNEIIRLEKSTDLNVQNEEFSDTEKVWLLDESLKNWLATEPKLANVPLSEYFYIAHETLRISTKAGRQLPPEIQSLLSQLQDNSTPVRQNAIKKILNLAEEDIQSIYSAILSRALKNPNDRAFVGLIELSYQHEKTMVKFITELKKVDPISLDGKLVLQIAGLKNKYSRHISIVDDLLNLWKGCNKKTVSKAAEAALKPSPIIKQKEIK